MKYLLLLLLLSCNKNHCPYDWKFKQELIIPGSYGFGYGQTEVYHNGKYLWSGSFNPRPDSLYSLTWEISAFLEKVPKGDPLIVKTRLFDWRDKSYYYLPADTLVK